MLLSELRSPGLVLGDTSSDAYWGDKGKTAYDHSQIIAGNPHGLTLGDLGGVSHSLATAANDFLVASGSGVFAKQTLAEVKSTLGLANYLALAGGTMSGAITLANLTNALNSGDYSIQLKDNLSTDDYGIKIDSNIRHDKLVQISSGGGVKMQMKATTGVAGTFTFDTSTMNAVLGSLNFISPGAYATISFTTGANSLGFNPGVNAVTTNNATTINFVANNGSVPLASFTTTAWLPLFNYATQDLGSLIHPFKDFYQLDNGKHYFGDAQDASIYYDGTDLIVNPKLVGTGTLKMSGDVSMNVNNLVLDTTTGTKIGTVGGSSGQKLAVLGATPIVQQLLPTGAGKTVDDVITVLQNFGIARQI